jgi:hypothetical protein
MIRGINSLPYINLDSHIDVEGFSALHYEMCKGIVMAEHKKEGNMVKPAAVEQYKFEFKPLFKALEEYHALPDDHEIKKIGMEIGEYKNRDKFMLFLKLALGAYDPYQFIFLKTEDGGWETRFEEKAWTADAVNYFPKVKAWIEQEIQDKVFKTIGRIIIFKAEHDCKMQVHRDLLEDESDYYPHRHEFIHIRPNLDKPFYIQDPEKNIVIPVKSHACFFNDLDWHSGGSSKVQTYSMRIDGVFSEEFRKRVGIDHLDQY